MKILFLNHNVKGRGTYVRCFQFARHLVRFGHSVTILTSTPEYIFAPSKEFIEGVEIISMPDILGYRARNGGLGPIDTFLRCGFLLTRKFDIVENFDHRPAVLYPALVSKYLCKTPLISEWTDLHGTGGSLSNRPQYLQNVIGPYENFTEKNSKKIAEKLIVISHGLKNKALKLGIPESKIVHIPGGADIDRIVPSPKGKARQKFGLPENAKLIGYTGYSHYDMDMFLSAVSIVQKQMKDVWLVTTGEILSEKNRKYLLKQDRLIELGFLSSEEYAAFLPCMDLFVFPYADKSININRWPNKIGDYMAAGRPIVTNRTGEMIEIYKKNNIGLLASDDPKDFADKIIDVLSDAKQCMELGKNARKTAEKYYDWKLLSKRLETCFFSVLKPMSKA